MPPFWASQRQGHGEDEQTTAVLPTDGYAEAPRSGRPHGTVKRQALFPSGVSSRDRRKSSPQRPARHTLPAAEVRVDARRERQWSNKHVHDKREGAALRAEALRNQILRGSQDRTVARGSKAFEIRDHEGYSVVDALQPEGCAPAHNASKSSAAAVPSFKRSLADLEDESSSDSQSSSDPNAIKTKRRRASVGPPPAKLLEAAPARARTACTTSTGSTDSRQRCVRGVISLAAEELDSEPDEVRSTGSQAAGTRRKEGRHGCQKDSVGLAGDEHSSEPDKVEHSRRRVDSQRWRKGHNRGKISLAAKELDGKPDPVNHDRDSADGQVVVDFF